MAEYRTLENTDLSTLYEAFLLAFSDYSVKIDMPFKRFEALLKRNGYKAEISAGAFDGDTLAGFILNGLRDWDGTKTAYDSGTGVIPEYRHKGLTTGMFGFLAERLKAAGVSQYILEVIKSNLPAYDLYRKLGFSVLREFNCYKIDRAELNLPEPADIVYAADLGFLETALSFWDFRPSWQNASDSVRCAEYAAAVAMRGGEFAGYGIVNPFTGSFYQMAVKEKYRRQGIGTALLSALNAKVRAEKISFLNVDSRDEGMNAFLINKGFYLETEQYEMILKL